MSVSRRSFVKGSRAVGAGGLLVNPAAQASARAVPGRRSGITYTQGTNMSVAVSPSGSRLVIEIQGASGG